MMAQKQYKRYKQYINNVVRFPLVGSFYKKTVEDTLTKMGVSCSQEYLSALEFRKRMEIRGAKAT